RDPVAPRALPRAAAGLLLRGFPDAQREAAERRHRAHRLLEATALRGKGRLMEPPAGATPGYLRLPLRLAGGLGGLADPAVAPRLGAARSYPSSLGALTELRARLVGPARRSPGDVELVSGMVTLPPNSLPSVRDR